MRARAHKQGVEKGEAESNDDGNFVTGLEERRRAKAAAKAAKEAAKEEVAAKEKEKGEGARRARG